MAEAPAIGYALRPASEADVDAVAGCVHAAYRHYVERIGRPPGPMTDDYAEVIRERKVTLAESAGRVVGVLVLALTVLGDESRFDCFRNGPAARAVRETALEISRRLGYRDSRDGAAAGTAKIGRSPASPSSPKRQAGAVRAAGNGSIPGR